jgi:hypothetical protein
MIDAAVNALEQMLSPQMRSILWRSIGLALVLIAVLAIGLQRLLSFLAFWLSGFLAFWRPGASLRNVQRRCPGHSIDEIYNRSR